MTLMLELNKLCKGRQRIRISGRRGGRRKKVSIKLFIEFCCCKRVCFIVFRIRGIARSYRVGGHIATDDTLRVRSFMLDWRKIDSLVSWVTRCKFNDSNPHFLTIKLTLRFWPGVSFRSCLCRLERFRSWQYSVSSFVFKFKWSFFGF